MTKRRTVSVDLLVPDPGPPARPRSEIRSVAPDGYGEYYAGGWRVDRCPTADEQARGKRDDED